MNENISPEEKLLRLIKGQKNEENHPEKKPEFQKITPALPSNAKRMINRTSALNPPLLMRILARFGLKKLLFVLFVLSSSYLAISLIYPRFAMKEISLPKAQTLKVEEEIQPSKEVKPFDYYLEVVGTRKVFGSSSERPLEKPPEIMGTEMMKDFVLVGIISGENPQAVIEDKKNHKTYYVTKGQVIAGMQVEDIREGKIILNADGKKYELYL